ncbi:Aldo/keto reductase [Xylariaceae sp. FL0016]|nr:Aldo/keto reductase [Xylariaceae sp. FL0016]
MAYGVGKLQQIPLTLQASIESTRVEYRKLGRSGLRVSNPILGGLQFGSSQWLPWVMDEEKATHLLKQAYDYGINTWDTANTYSNGESERIMGRALRKHKIPRRKVVLMSKCYRVVSDPEHYEVGSSMAFMHEHAAQSKDYVNNWGLSRNAIFASVEASLERLNTTYLDVLQIHRYDETVEPEETMRALHDLVVMGKVRYLGASSMWTYQFAKLQHTAEKRGWTKFVAMQNHYNLLYREEEREMIKYCNETGVGLIPWAPLASGQLARPYQQNGKSLRSALTKNGGIYHDDDDLRSEAIIMRVEEVANKRGWPMSHVALAWLYRRVTAAVIGFSSHSQLNDIVAARGKLLTADEERYLEEAYRPRFVQGHS